MYNLISSYKDHEDLFVGFDKDPGRRVDTFLYETKRGFFFSE